MSPLLKMTLNKQPRKTKVKRPRISTKRPGKPTKKRRQIQLKARKIDQGFVITLDLYRQWRCEQSVCSYPNICVSSNIADTLVWTENAEYQLNDTSERNLPPEPCQFV